ncbi:MAG: YggS family pyridoxal phosphate-dependent enzyme [Epulopiscium sp.]|jgi:pyridoxal phosphate enzyme (YggS family)|nr:YggS family pyridoxal phosphate-dependent enzyme [Candidatus Epulonipiscium sp.]
MIQDNIMEIKDKIKQAALRSGRLPEDILLLAVTKTIDTDRIQEAVEAGLTSLGENKVQEILNKYETMGENVKWHLIGHLQTNKVKYIIDKVELIHSVESLKLAEEIEKRAAAKNIIMPILIEVNIAQEDSKFGLHPSEVENFIRNISTMQHICIKGLMTVAPFVENPEENRYYFRQLRELLVDINEKKIDNVHMDILSMGMTGDYEVAIEEGATIVRVGTGIFGKRLYPEKVNK